MSTWYHLVLKATQLSSTINARNAAAFHYCPSRVSFVLSRAEFFSAYENSLLIRS